jgi:hypothetical protein
MKGNNTNNPALSASQASYYEATAACRLLTFDDEYKFRVWAVDEEIIASNTSAASAPVTSGPASGLDKKGAVSLNTSVSSSAGGQILSSTNACRRTAVTPTFGGPVNRMQIVMAAGVGGGNETHYAVYTASSKVLGLIALPVDGNPLRSASTVAHPGRLSAFAVSFDGKYVFTAGGSDLCVSQWNINTNAIDTSTKLGGGITSLAPYKNLIQGGEHGAFYREMKDYFYYAQIRSQGEDTMSTRALDGTIPLNEIPDMMCALGYYPSKADERNLENEVKYKQFHLTGKLQNRIDFDDFVRLYVNYRPLFGADTSSVRCALKALVAEASVAAAPAVDTSDDQSDDKNKQGENKTSGSISRDLLLSSLLRNYASIEGNVNLALDDCSTLSEERLGREVSRHRRE